MYSKRLSGLLLLILVSTATAQSTMANSDGVWPRAVLIVFERRIPERLAVADDAGERLRELREKVTEQIQALQLHKGDQIFVFADGISQNDFNCLVHGLACEGASPGSHRLQWSDSPAAARGFLARMLQLPTRPNPLNSNRVVGSSGEQFLHLNYDGNWKTVDCAIRREITAPLTKGYDVSSECPTEGVKVDREQSKAISRVEMSLPVQVDAALGANKGNSPVRSVTWIWALLGEKNYNRADTINGIRQDFDHSEALVDFFEHADQAYTVHLLQPPLRLANGQSVVIHKIEGATTLGLLDEIGKSAESLIVTLGRQKKIAVQGDLSITAGFLGGSWRPEVDCLCLSANLSPEINGSLLGGLVEFTGYGPSLPVAPVEGVVNLQSDRAEEGYQNALHSNLWQRGTNFKAHLDLLVAGPDFPQPYGFIAIPGSYSMFRSVQVERTSASTREISIAAAFLVATIVFLIYVLRPHSFTVSTRPSKLEWTFPSEKLENELQLKLVGYSQAFGRRFFAGPTDIAIKWVFFPPQGLPVKQGHSPIQVLADDEPIHRGVWHIEARRWRPGSADKPREIGLLRIRLDGNAFDSTSVSHPESLGSIFQLQVRVAPKLPLRLRSAEETFFLPATIHIAEESPHPQFSFHIESSYRRLGFVEQVEGGIFGHLALENMPERGGVCRDIAARLSIEILDSPNCVVTFDTPGQPTTCSFFVRSHERKARRLLLTPTENQPDPLPKLVRGRITGELIDKGTGVLCCTINHSWTLTWLPKGARLVGLDVGTSGARLFLDNPARRHADIQARFSMSSVNQGDTEELVEFPSLVRIHERRGVVRAGSHQFGVYFEGGGRLVESPKAALLSALDHDGEEQARADFKRYVSAIAKTWATIRTQHNIDYARFVVTVPWSYGQATANWYRELIKKHFEGVVLVTFVREAESAAYFHLLRDRVAAPSGKERFPRDREHRTLVVDVGAGTVDFAVVAVRAPSGTIQEPAILAHTFSYWAGNRYDEELLAQVFDIENARELMLQDRQLRDTIRLFKQERLSSMLSGSPSPGPVLIGGLRVSPAVTEREEFLKKMDPWYENAFSGPLAKIAEQLGESKLQIDELLLAGRGVLAYGCRDRIESDVRRIFQPAPMADSIPTASFAGEDLPWVIAKGALSFSRSGLVLVGDSDFVNTKDVTLVVDLENEIKTHPLFKAGTLQNDATRQRNFGSYSREINHAWILAGTPFLSGGLIDGAVALLRTNDLPRNGVLVLDSWREPAGLRRLVLQIENEQSVQFVRKAPRIGS